MSNPTLSIVCDLRWGGFDGSDIDDILDDGEMMLERGLKCEVSYRPCALGPCSWFIIITVGSMLTKVGEAFLKELGKDLHRWSAERLKPVFTKKSNGDGWAEVRFDDTKIEVPFHPSEPAFADCWFCISDLLKTQDLSESEWWRVEKTDSGLGFKLVPCDEPC